MLRYDFIKFWGRSFFLKQQSHPSLILPIRALDGIFVFTRRFDVVRVSGSVHDHRTFPFRSPARKTRNEMPSGSACTRYTRSRAVVNRDLEALPISRAPITGLSIIICFVKSIKKKNK
jgi:hypothetical protein